MKLDDIHTISTYKLKVYKGVIEAELNLREKHALRSNLWCAKVSITKELAYRVKK